MAGHIARDYIRTEYWRVDAKISADGHQWHEVLVPNISASGLLFLTDRSFAEGDVVWLDIYINPIMVGTDVRLKNVKALINNNRGVRDGKNAYAVRFTEIPNDDQIQLDELVRQTIAKYSETVLSGF